MYVKKYTERFEMRLTPTELTRLKAISLKLNVSDAHAARICINDYWDLSMGIKNANTTAKASKRAR